MPAFCNRPRLQSWGKDSCCLPWRQPLRSGHSAAASPGAGEFFYPSHLTPRPRQSGNAMRAPLIAALLELAVFGGCATTRYSDTSRTGMEQLLISNAVDQALDRVEFPQLAGQSVWIDDKYIECTDKAYVVGCVRHRVLAAGAKLADKADNADIVLEVRSGGVGTDKVEAFFGVPPIAVPGPMPINLPEIRLLGRQTQTGTAKLGIVAYHAKARRAIGDGGMALAKAHDHGWMILGMGPYFSGEVREEVAAATGNGSISSETARAAAKRGYRTSQGKLANVALADERAALLASARPAAPAPAVADARGQTTPGAVRPASATSPMPGAAPPPGMNVSSTYPPVRPPMAPQMGPLGPLPEMPAGGFFPAMPSPATLGGP